MAKTRNLKSGEKELLAQVFVKTLPLDRVRITDKLGIGDRAYTLPMLLSKNYHVNVGDYYGADMSKSEDGRRLLIHECMHVWQGVHGFFEWDYVVNSVVCQGISAFKKDSAYDYQLGKDWKKYGAEAQASIVEDWYGKDDMLVTSERWRYIRDNLRETGFGGEADFIKSAQFLRWVIGDGAKSGYPKEIASEWNSFVKGADAGFSRMIGDTEYYYFFKGDEYTKIKSGSGVVSGYPKKIDGNWDSTFIKDGVDAVLYPDGMHIYFFKGNQYIRYTIGSGQDSGYPKKISDSFNSTFIKDGFDTCIYWGNGKAYFFKGDEYIRYTVGDGVDSGYPKKIGDTWHSFMRSGLKVGILKHKDVF